MQKRGFEKKNNRKCYIRYGTFSAARRYASGAGTSYGPASVRLCLSVTSRCSIKRDERIDFVFGKAPFDQSCPAL